MPDIQNVNLKQLTMLQTSCWYAEQYDTAMTPFNGSEQDIKQLLQQIQQKCKQKFEYNQKQTQEGRIQQRYNDKIERSGTHADKRALYVLRLKASPFAYTDDLQLLMSDLQQSKRSVTETIGAVFDIINYLMPTTRNLISLQTRLQMFKNQIFSSEDTLLMIYFEDQLNTFMNKLYDYISGQCKDDVLPQLRLISNEYFSVIAKYSVYQKASIKLLLNSFQDLDDKVCQQAVKMMLRIEDQVSQIESVIQIIQLFQEKFLNINKQSKLVSKQFNNCLNYLNQLQLLSKPELKQLNTDLCDTLLNMLYFNLKLRSNDEKDNLLVENNNKDKNQTGKEKKPNKDKKVKNTNNNNNQQLKKHEIQEFGLNKQILQLISKLFKNINTQQFQQFNKHTQQLTEIAQKSYFNLAVQILSLLIKLLRAFFDNSQNNQQVQQIANYVIQLVYNLCGRYDSIIVSQNSKHSQFLNQIVQLNKLYVCGISLNKQLISSIYKKLIQNQLIALNPEALTNSLLTLQISSQINYNEQKKLNINGQQNKIKSNQFNVVNNILPFSNPFNANNQVTEKHQFNYNQDNPLQTKAVNDQFYELLLLQNHYHPSVKLFANQYINTKQCVQYIDVEKHFQDLIKQKLIKQTKERIVVDQPFSYQNICQVIQGDTRMLQNKNNKQFNQIHLSLLNHLFCDQKESINTKTNIKTKLKSDDDIDNIILQDLIKKGIVQKDAQFNEIKKLLDNDQEYQQMITNQQQQNDKQGQIVFEQLDQPFNENGEEEELFENDEEFIEEEEEELELENNEKQPEYQNDQNKRAKREKFPKLMPVEEYWRIREEKDKQSKQFIPKQTVNQNNKLFQALKKRVNE